MATLKQPQAKSEAQDDWILTAAQMIFMLQHHNVIDEAYANDDLDCLRELAASEAFKSAFGDMSWDEAYDRYECMLESGHGDS